jgi:rubrerythrin
MSEISRRYFLNLCAAAPILAPLSALAAQMEGKSSVGYPRTVAVLKESYLSEMSAYRHYAQYTSQAIKEKYPNIAYLFYSFSHSEKIHAENYEKILAALGHKLEPVSIVLEVHDTKANLRAAAANELKKIRLTYPGFMRELQTESKKEAIVSCSYSWESHKQHEEKVKEIERYAGLFFSAVSGRIEGSPLDFHVCTVCGSTLDKAPTGQCIICRKALSNYRKIERPV